MRVCARALRIAISLVLFQFDQLCVVYWLAHIDVRFLNACSAHPNRLVTSPAFPFAISAASPFCLFLPFHSSACLPSPAFLCCQTHRRRLVRRRRGQRGHRLVPRQRDAAERQQQAVGDILRLVGRAPHVSGRRAVGGARVGHSRAPRLQGMICNVVLVQSVIEIVNADLFCRVCCWLGNTNFFTLFLFFPRSVRSENFEPIIFMFRFPPSLDCIGSRLMSHALIDCRYCRLRTCCRATRVSARTRWRWLPATSNSLRYRHRS